MSSQPKMAEHSPGAHVDPHHSRIGRMGREKSPWRMQSYKTINGFQPSRVQGPVEPDEIGADFDALGPPIHRNLRRAIYPRAGDGDCYEGPWRY